MENKELLSTREIAEFLNINEKMVYSLISEKGLPATKVTGKWLFPRHLVEQWLENKTVNYPKTADTLPSYQGLLILAGSNDILLEKVMSLFNRLYSPQITAFANLGSLGGIRALRKNQCHIATSHLLQENEDEYNFGFAREELGQIPAIVNFCKREQGLLMAKGNPKEIANVADLAKPGLKVVNRPLGTGTRLLFDSELKKANIDISRLKGYEREFQRHLEIGLEVLSGRADVGPGIKAVAGLLALDFIPLRWEQFDLLILKDRFFDQSVQSFLGMLNEQPFQDLARDLSGYDLGLCGKMVYPQPSVSMKVGHLPLEKLV